MSTLGNGRLVKRDTFEIYSTTPPLEWYFSQRITETNLTNPIGITAGEVDCPETITVDDPTGAAAGKYIELWEGPFFMQVEIKSVLGSDITLHMPVGFPFTIAANAYIVNVDMNVDGSVTPQTFRLEAGPAFTSDLYITRFVIVMTHSGAGDDSKFGSIAALTNGLYFGSRGLIPTQIGPLVIVNNLFNVKTNKDLRVRTYDIDYSDKAGGGNFGTSSRKTFNGPEKSGMAIPIYLQNNDSPFAIVRDNLSVADMVTLRVALNGRVQE